MKSTERLAISFRKKLNRRTAFETMDGLFGCDPATLTEQDVEVILEQSYK